MFLNFQCYFHNFFLTSHLYVFNVICGPNCSWIWTQRKIRCINNSAHVYTWVVELMDSVFMFHTSAVLGFSQVMVVQMGVPWVLIYTLCLNQKESAFKELLHRYGCVSHLHNHMAWPERFLTFRDCCISSKFNDQPNLELVWVGSFTCPHHPDPLIQCEQYLPTQFNDISQARFKEL